MTASEALAHNLGETDLNTTSGANQVLENVETNDGSRGKKLALKWGLGLGGLGISAEAGGTALAFKGFFDGALAFIQTAQWDQYTDPSTGQIYDTLNFPHLAEHLAHSPAALEFVIGSGLAIAGGRVIEFLKEAGVFVGINEITNNLANKIFNRDTITEKV